MIFKIIILVGIFIALIFAVRHLYKVVRKMVNPPLPEGFEDFQEEIKEPGESSEVQEWTSERMF